MRMLTRLTRQFLLPATSHFGNTKKSTNEKREHKREERDTGTSTMKRSLSLLVASSLVAPALGWVTRAESVTNTVRPSLNVLRAAADDSDEIDSYRAMLEQRYSSSYRDLESPSDFFDSNRISRLRDEESSPLVESNGDWSEDALLSCGDECEVS